jgi:FkbM family methyltransferase
MIDNCERRKFMSVLRRLARRAAEALGYSISRWPANRFDGMRDALLLLRARGYIPAVVVDCGANQGDWTRLASSIFPAARFHLIEPQPACQTMLAASGRSGIVVHAVAVTQPGIASVRMIGAGDDVGTGAWVAAPGDSVSGGVVYPATTLDELIAPRINLSDRALLKLDLEGHELAALKGAEMLLGKTEVIVTEVEFFHMDGIPRPLFPEVLAFLQDRSFELYDFASLSSRPRDRRLRIGDVVFVRRDSSLVSDHSWE